MQLMLQLPPLLPEPDAAPMGTQGAAGRGSGRPGRGLNRQPGSLPGSPDTQQRLQALAGLGAELLTFLVHQRMLHCFKTKANTG
ncbi:hypothetical protein HaLaN_06772 [Haematococcus lacustris]|uniref:Uncharacterized protein n=1 Tax=Haematococcus lacustris TaxID=44745 RepID=A0A699YWS8_HAELA|nr:hypothetical protein HaLaN_06772 [Haematococcus lacustris]